MVREGSFAHQTTSAMIAQALKSVLKKSAPYRHYFARQQAPLIIQWSREDQKKLEFYSRLSVKGLVFDIGANLGNRTKVFVRLGCRVIAIEPQRNCAAALKRAFGNRIEVVHCAVSDSIGSAELRAANLVLASLSQDFIDSTRESGRFAAEQWHETQKVRTTTFDALIARYGEPKFTKIDVEGHEASVLLGLSTPVSSLSFEFHPETLLGALACIESLDRLAQYHYNFSYGEILAFNFPAWIASDEMSSFLKQEKHRWGDVYARRN